jgi:hypothetical protein
MDRKRPKMGRKCPKMGRKWPQMPLLRLIFCENTNWIPKCTTKRALLSIRSANFIKAPRSPAKFYPGAYCFFLFFVVFLLFFFFFPILSFFFSFSRFSHFFFFFSVANKKNTVPKGRFCRPFLRSTASTTQLRAPTVPFCSADSASKVPISTVKFPKMAPKKPKMAPKTLKMAPKTLKMAPKTLKMAIKTVNSAPQALDPGARRCGCGGTAGTRC